MKFIIKDTDSVTISIVNVFLQENKKDAEKQILLLIYSTFLSPIHLP